MTIIFLFNQSIPIHVLYRGPRGKLHRRVNVKNTNFGWVQHKIHYCIIILTVIRAGPEPIMKHPWKDSIDVCRHIIRTVYKLRE